MTDFYEIFERFCIMTVDGGLSDEQALKYINRRYGFNMAHAIWQRIKK